MCDPCYNFFFNIISISKLPKVSMQWTRIPDPGGVKTLPVTLRHENKPG